MNLIFMGFQGARPLPVEAYLHNRMRGTTETMAVIEIHHWSPAWDEPLPYTNLLIKGIVAYARQGGLIHGPLEQNPYTLCICETLKLRVHLL